MLDKSKHHDPEVSRRGAEATLISSRNKFLAYLRRRLNSASDVEDVFQDFCIKVLRNHATIKSGDRLDVWLAITLRHTLTDHYRRQATRNRGSEAYAIEAMITKPDPVDDGPAHCSCVNVALKRLNSPQDDLLMRIDLQDETRISVAADLGLSTNSLRVRLHRARNALKQKIKELCPVCGEGGFMSCDCDHSNVGQDLLSPPQVEIPVLA
jgi:RNA polymerase sigma-70 factor (ECF subfamily)